MHPHFELNRQFFLCSFDPLTGAGKCRESPPSLNCSSVRSFSRGKDFPQQPHLRLLLALL